MPKRCNIWTLRLPLDGKRCQQNFMYEDRPLPEEMSLHKQLLEVQDMDAEVAALWKEVSTKFHVRGQAAARRNVAPQAAARDDAATATGGMKLVAELKPEVLSHDATAGELRIWLF